MSKNSLPTHPRTGLRAVGLVNGRPVWPILGGSQPAGDDGSGAGDDGEGGSAGAGSDDGRGQDGGSGGDDSGTDDFAAVLRELKLTPAQARRMLKTAPTWEKRARENLSKAEQAKTLEQQIESLRSTIAERDMRDLERSGRMAVSQVRERLSRNGVDPDDVRAILDRVSVTDLLKDGEPDEDAVTALAESLLKVAGRVQPDPDQGKKGGEKGESMDAFIRRAAGRGARTIR